MQQNETFVLTIRVSHTRVKIERQEICNATSIIINSRRKERNGRFIVSSGNKSVKTAYS